MLLARIEGNAVSTIHHPSLRGWRLLICQPVDDSGQTHGHPILALDELGAGEGQTAIITSDGKSVREKIGNPNTPARYMTIALLDDVTTEEAGELLEATV